jgi:List-Bact-rpt repeat protein
VRTLLALGLGIAALVAAPAKPTLTVVVNGDGGVSSRPAGISCPSTCTLRVKKGTKVTLTATPAAGSTFSRWSAPCGTATTCTVTVTRSTSLRAAFKEQQTTISPPPPPWAKDGHYVGTYTDGTYMTFDVQSLRVGNFIFDTNGSCDNGGTSWSTLHVFTSRTLSIQPSGAFTGESSFTLANGSNVTVDIDGTFTPTGSASGTLRVALDFTNDVHCTSSGTWTAQDQS